MWFLFETDLFYISLLKRNQENYSHTFVISPFFGWILQSIDTYVTRNTFEMFLRINKVWKEFNPLFCIHRMA